MGLSERAIPLEESAVTGSAEDQKHESVFSGPVQIWDLTTGQVRLIELPEQAHSDRLVPTNYSDELIPLDPQGWMVEHTVIAKESSTLCLIQKNRHGERLSVRIDLDRGTVSRVQMPSHCDKPDIETSVSHSGRWCVEVERVEGRDSLHEQLKLIDTLSGRNAIEFDAVHGMQTHSFSDDETLFAFSASDDSNDGTTQIWQLDPPRQLRVIPHMLGGIAFSPDHKSIASADYRSVEVLDIETGALVHHFTLPDVSLQQPYFSPDGTTLIAYAYMRGGGSGIAPSHCIISEVHVWNLETLNQSTFLPSHISNDFSDPNLCHDGWSDHTTPLVIADHERLIDLVTGQTVLRIPDKTSVESFLPSGRTVVLLQSSQSPLNKLMKQLRGWKVPIPATWWMDDDQSCLEIRDVPSGKLRCWIPYNGLWVTRGSLLISPDEKTWVTVNMNDDESVVAQVWDMPARRAWLQPLLWSLLAPACWLFGVKWSQLRRRKRVA